MKTLMKLGILIPLIMLITGCQNMMHKAVVVDSSVKALKITLGDPSQNPFPQVIIGFGHGALIDMPMQDGAEVFYYSEDSAIFSGSLSGKTMVYMKAGKGVINGHVKVELEDKRIVDIPIFKLYDFLSYGKDVIIDGATVEPMKK